MSGSRSRTNTAEERVRRTTPEDGVPPSPARAQLEESLSVVDTVTALAATLHIESENGGGGGEKKDNALERKFSQILQDIQTEGTAEDSEYLSSAITQPSKVSTTDDLLKISHG